MPIYAGTDAGSMVAHGRIADEVAALRGVGMTATDALGAASLGCAKMVGPKGNRARRVGRPALLRRPTRASPVCSTIPTW